MQGGTGDPKVRAEEGKHGWGPREACHPPRPQGCTQHGHSPLLQGRTSRQTLRAPSQPALPCRRTPATQAPAGSRKDLHCARLACVAPGLRTLLLRGRASAGGSHPVAAHLLPPQTKKDSGHLSPLSQPGHSADPAVQEATPHSAWLGVDGHRLPSGRWKWQHHHAWDGRATAVTCSNCPFADEKTGASRGKLQLTQPGAGPLGDRTHLARAKAVSFANRQHHFWVKAQVGMNTRHKFPASPCCLLVQTSRHRFWETGKKEWGQRWPRKAPPGPAREQHSTGPSTASSHLPESG